MTQWLLNPANQSRREIQLTHPDIALPFSIFFPSELKSQIFDLFRLSSIFNKASRLKWKKEVLLDADNLQPTPLKADNRDETAKLS